MNDKDKDLVAQRFVTEPGDMDAIFNSLTVLEPIGEKVVNPLNYSAKGK